MAFALLSLNRALTFTSFYSYIFNGFDPSMYGRLLGTLCLGSSLCSLSQPALSSLVAYKFHGNYTYVNIGFTCLPVVSLLLQGKRWYCTTALAHAGLTPTITMTGPVPLDLHGSPSGAQQAPRRCPGTTAV